MRLFVKVLKAAAKHDGCGPPIEGSSPRALELKRAIEKKAAEAAPVAKAS